MINQNKLFLDNNRNNSIIKKHSMREKEISDKEERINKLHNRHLAKLLSKLNEIKTPQVGIEAVKKQLSHYTNDIKEQVLISKSNDNSNKS